MQSNEDFIDKLLILPPLAEIDPEAAADEFFTTHAEREQDATRCVVDVVDASAIIATDMMWPSILDAARKLPDLGEIDFNNWRMRPISVQGHSEAFVLEQMSTDEGVPLYGNGGGYVINLKLERIMSEDGEKKLKELDKGEFNSLDPSDPDFIRKRLQAAFRPSAERTAITQDPSNYLPRAFCNKVEEIICIAFKSKTGRNPDGYDGTDSFSDPLEKILSSGFTGYQKGEVFEYRPSRMSADRDGSPSLPASAGVRNVAGAVFAMRKLSEALSVLGYGADIANRARQSSGVRYIQFAQEAGRLRRAIGAGAVFRDGGLFGKHAHAAAVGFLARSATADISKRMKELGELAGYLQDGGHTTPDNEYDCNDADDFGHVVAKDDGTRTLFIRTQHNQYRIDITEEEDRIAGVFLGIIPEERFDAPMPYIGDTGFLGYFSPDEDGTIVGYNVDLLHTTRLLGFNDLAFTIDSMHCCWEEEHGEKDEPDSP